MAIYKACGLGELWVRAGTGETTRYVPLHTLYEQLGPQLCSVLPAVHSLIGCDITSKVGTKKAALKADPQKFLKNFGESPTISVRSIQNAEKFLIKVLKKTSEASDLTTYVLIRNIPLWKS